MVRYKQMIEHKKKQLIDERMKSKSLTFKKNLLVRNFGRGVSSEKQMHLKLSRIESLKDDIL